MSAPEYDVIPTARGLRIECWHPAQHCSIACMKDMCGLNYSETVNDSADRKTINIEQWSGCDYQMSHGLYSVALNVCRMCRNSNVKAR